jgi:hypothetical protein
MTVPAVHDEYVANILDTYTRASDAQKHAGRQWYDDAYRIVRVIADATNTDTARVCFVLAALSPRNPWRWNVQDAYAFCSAHTEGRTMPSATTFGRNRTAAWQALDSGQAPWATAAPKVTAFVDAILGDSASVVVDSWAYRVATNQRSKTVKNREYRLIAAAYRQAAEQVGETPANMQAITWLVAQTEGLASHRRGRHDLSFKAGTPDFLKEAIR